MNNINKVVIFFFALVFLTAGLTWKVMQSEFFGNKISKVITEKISNDLNMETKFSSIELTFFPPGIILNDLNLEQNENYKKWNLDFLRLEVYFNVLDLITNKISIKEIVGDVGKLNIEVIKKNKNDTDFADQLRKFDLREISFEKIKKHIVTLPIVINQITINKTSISINNKEQGELNASLKYFAKSFDLYFDFFPSQNLREKYFFDYVQSEIYIKPNIFVVENFELKERDNSLSMSLLGNLKKSKTTFENIDFNGTIKIEGEIGNTARLLGIQENYVDFSLLRSTSKVERKNNNLEIKTKVKLKEMESKFVRFENADLEITLSDNKVYVEKLQVKKGSESYFVDEKILIYNLLENRLVYPTVRLFLKNAHSNTFLKALSPTMDKLNLILNGSAVVEFKKDEVVFRINDNLTSSRALLLSEPRIGFKIIDVSNIVFSDTELTLNYDTLEFNFDIMSKIQNAQVYSTGTINSQKIDVDTKIENYSYDSIGEIAGIKFDGVGDLRIWTKSKWDDVRLKINYDLKDLILAELKLGDVKGGAEIFFESQKVEILGLLGKYKETQYVSSGEYNFNNKSLLDLKIDVSNTNVIQAYEITEVFSKNIEYIPKKMIGALSTQLRINLDFREDKIQVKGKTRGKNLFYLGENFRRLDFNYEYNKEKVVFNNVKLLKDEGSIKGNLEYYFDKSKYGYNLFVDGINIKEIDFYKHMLSGLDGKITIKSNGHKFQGEEKGVIDLQITDLKSNRNEVGNSKLLINYNQNELLAKGSFLQDSIFIDSKVNFKKEKSSYFNMFFNALDLRSIFSVVSEHNLFDQNLSGKLKGKLLLKFNYYNLSTLDLNFYVDDFLLNRKGISFSLSEKDPLIEIKNGEIKKWDVENDGNDFSVLSAGRGSLKDGVKVLTSINMGASITELISKDIIETSGVIWVKNEVDFSLTNISHITEFGTRNVSFALDRSPLNLKSLNSKISFKNKKLLIDNFKGDLGEGKVQAFGELDFNNLVPRIELRTNFDKASINLFNNSFLKFSGRLNLSGLSAPYKLSGNLVVDQGDFKDELSEFSKKSSVSSEHGKYLPKTNVNNFVNFVNMDIKTSLLNGVNFKNSLGELKLVGDLNLLGTPFNPKLGGTLVVEDGSGRFYFKSNDFIIKRGLLEFDQNVDISSLKLDLWGVTTIGEYIVNLTINGEPSKLNISIFSDPPLSQKEILSLLALGYKTDDLGEDLGEEAQQSLYSAGIGSFIFERFKINRELRNSLGLRLTLTPELEEDESSLINQKSSSSSGSTGRIKSGTKLKVQKSLNRDLNLSISSTVGGTLNQKQEMNLDYELNDNLILQGIYELSEDEDGTKQENSAGADFKFKWTFK